MSKQEQNDTFNIIDLEKTMLTKANDEVLVKNHELQFENKKLKLELSELEAKVFHLEKLLKSLPKVTEVGKVVEVSPEETIAELQLSHLKKVAMERELTLDEVRKFDLLVKNKRLSTGNSTQNAKFERLDNLTNEELMLLASQGNKKDE